MDTQIKKYLESIAFLVTPEQYNAMFDDANSLDTKSWLNKYQDMAMNDETLAATWRKYGFDKYSKDIWERMRDTFGSSDKENPFDKPEAWLKAQWTADYPDLSFEDFKKKVAASKQFWDDEKRAREYNAGKVRREREVKDWPWYKNLVASDYSKQRYINEPETSIFSNEGEWYNKGEDISDVSLGVLGLAGDIVPGYGIVLGPAARAARDIRHKAEDSQYQKDWSTIGTDFAQGAATNAAFEVLPNARRYTSMLKRSSKNTPVEQVMRLEDDVNDLRKQVDFIDSRFTGGNYVDLIADINNLPDGAFKNEMLEHIKDIRHIDEDAIAETIAKYRMLSDYWLTKEGKDIIDLAKKDVNKTATLEGADEVFTEPLTQRMILSPKLTKTEAAEKAVVDAFTKNVNAKTGAAVLKGAATAKGRDAGVTADKERITKDWYKQHYARDWDLGFKPNEKEGDPLWEAYIEWKAEKEGK